MRLRTPALILVAITTVAMVSGCTHQYFAITDTESGRAYYSKRVKEKMGGGIAFRDEKTGARVKLSAHEVVEISKFQFRAGLRDGGDYRSN